MNSSSVDCDFVREMLCIHSDMVMRIAYQNVKNQADAEDIAQEVFLKLLTNRPEFHDEEHIKAWLIRVTINLCKNHFKTAWFRKTVAMTDSCYSFDEQQREVLSAIWQLPAKFRNVIYLHYYEGYTIVEMADILEQNQNTISSWLQRGRARLKFYLGGFEDEQK